MPFRSRGGNPSEALAPGTNAPHKFKKGHVEAKHPLSRQEGAPLSSAPKPRKACREQYRCTHTDEILQEIFEHHPKTAHPLPPPSFPPPKEKWTYPSRHPDVNVLIQRELPLKIEESQIHSNIGHNKGMKICSQAKNPSLVPNEIH